MANRLLFIDDDFNPTIRTGAEVILRDIIDDELKPEGYDIGPSNFAGYTRCPDGTKNPDCWDFGLSVRTHLQNRPFYYPVDMQSDNKLGSMFFAADAACAYFQEFVLNQNRWEEIVAVIVDIMMAPGTFLPAHYKDKIVNYDNAGDYLRMYIGELVAKFRIPQNPDTVLPVMVLTNKKLKKTNGLIHKPHQGGTNRLLVWGMEKEYATDHPKSLVERLNWIVAQRVR